MKSRSAIGFTLIELMVTITMIGIVLTVGVPSFQSSIRNSVLTAGINEFIAALNFARGEAIKRGVNVTVRRASAGSAVTLFCNAAKQTGYEVGWQVFTDANANGQLDGTDQLLRTHGPLSYGYTLCGNGNVNKDYISYLPDGVINTLGCSLALCDPTHTSPLTTSTARVISVNTLGRITLATDTNGNGILTYSSGAGSCAIP